MAQCRLTESSDCCGVVRCVGDVRRQTDCLVHHACCDATDYGRMLATRTYKSPLPTTLHHPHCPLATAGRRLSVSSLLHVTSHVAHPTQRSQCRTALCCSRYSGWIYDLCTPTSRCNCSVHRTLLLTPHTLYHITDTYPHTTQCQRLHTVAATHHLAPSR